MELLNMNDYIPFEICDRIPLFFVPNPFVKSVGVAMLFRFGSRDEIWPDETGLTHFWEHMVFKGNALFPTYQRISFAAEQYGGLINAFTAKEGTCFYAKHLVANFQKRYTYSVPFLRSRCFGRRT